MRGIGLALCGLLVGCAGRPLISPALEQSATRAALRASMAADEVTTPQDDPDLLAIGVTEDRRVALPVSEPSVSDAISEGAMARAASDATTAAEGARAAKAKAAAREVTEGTAVAGGRLRSDDPALARAIEQLTVELREQRMLTTMRLVAGERAVDDSTASPGAPAELERAVTRIEAAQEALAEDTAALATALDALRALVEERVPSDVETQLGEVRKAVREVTPALEEIGREQEALRARVERLESAPAAPPPSPVPTTQSYSLDELRRALEPAPEIDEAAQDPAEPAPEIGEAAQDPAEPAPEIDEAAQDPAEPAPEIDEAAQDPAEPAPEIGEAAQDPAEPAPEIDEEAKDPAPGAEVDDEAPETGDDMDPSP